MFNLKLTAFAGLILFAAACRKKDNPKPEKPDTAYRYKSLNDTEVKYLKPYSFDFNDDQEMDLFFTVSLLNDTEGTHGRFVVVARQGATLLSEVDSVVRLEENAVIPVVPDHPQEWNHFSKMLVEVIVPPQANLDTIWRGRWNVTGRRYFAAQFKKGDDSFVGWVSVSADTARDRIILHESAWRSLKAGNAKAGAR
ncbi:hypothetical protein ACWKWU_14345 [Chitinophaga lutea]